MKSLVLLLSLVLLNAFHSATSDEEDEIWAQERELPNYLKDDGIRRLARLGKQNFYRSLKQSKLLVVLFYFANNDQPSADKAWKSEEQMLEVVARVLQPQGVTVGSLNLANMDDMEFVQNLGVQFSGSIMIFHSGKKIEYNGHRSPDILVTFLHKMFEPPVTMIETKKQKKTFDDIASSKVIGYFEKGHTVLREFEEAAKQYQPLIPFFAVFDKKLAKSVRLKKLKGILLHKPYEKPVSFPAEQEITEANIKIFIEKNKKQIITKIRLEDIHETWSARVEGYLVTAFVRPKTTEGAKFFALVKSLARSYVDNSKLNFLWVDPDPFPMMRDFWQRSYRIDVSSPALGIIDPKKVSPQVGDSNFNSIASQGHVKFQGNQNRSAWFKSKAKEPKLKHLQQWVNDVLANKVEFMPTSNTTETTDIKGQTAENRREEL